MSGSTSKPRWPQRDRDAEEAEAWAFRKREAPEAAQIELSQACDWLLVELTYRGPIWGDTLRDLNDGTKIEPAEGAFHWPAVIEARRLIGAETKVSKDGRTLWLPPPKPS